MVNNSTNIKINFPHRLMDMGDRYWLRDDNSPDMENGMH